MGRLAFDGTGISSFSFPVSTEVTHIEFWTFRNCLKITQFSLPPSIQYIEGGAFENCINLKTFSISEYSELISIGPSVFRNTSLTTFYLPRSVEEISNYAFSFIRNIFQITFPSNSNLRLISDHAFRENGMTEIVLPKLLEEIDDQAFASCSYLTTVTFSEDSQLSYLGAEAFRDCNLLTRITIPQGVSLIRRGTFSGDYSLQEVVLLAEEIIVSDTAFEGCEQLSFIQVSDCKAVEFRHDIKCKEIDSSGGLSGGIIALIVILVILAVLGGGYGLYFFYMKSRIRLQTGAAFQPITDDLE